MRIGKKVSSVYIDPFYGVAVLRGFIKYHIKHIQRLKERLSFHRSYSMPDENESAKMQAVKSQLERYSEVVPNK